MEEILNYNENTSTSSFKKLSFRNKCFCCFKEFCMGMLIWIAFTLDYCVLLVFMF